MFSTACDPAELGFSATRPPRQVEPNYGQTIKQSNNIIQPTINPEVQKSVTAQSTYANPTVVKPMDKFNLDRQKVKVGLFFPFSGKNKELGVALYQAAMLSLFDNDTNHNLELVLVDSKDTAQDPTKTIDEIINKNIKIVIGPVFSKSVEAISQDMINHNITAISLSNNQALRGRLNNGGGVFVAGIMPEAQIEVTVAHAIDNNLTNFAILAPNNQYGLTISEILKRFVNLRDGRIITTEFYSPSGIDLEKAVDRIVKANWVPRKVLKVPGKKPKEVGVVKEEDRIYPQVILIPESGKMLTKITALIKEYNKDERDYQLIGTGEWDNEESLKDPNLEGGWFGAPSHERFALFEKSYYQNYQKTPPRIASIVYDSVAAIAELVDQHNDRELIIRDFTTYSNPENAKFKGLNGFDGIDGNFRFLENGMVQRNLAVLEIQNGDFKTIDKPANKFLKF